MKNLLFGILLIPSMLIGCASKDAKDSSGEEWKTAETAIIDGEIEIPRPPATLTTAQEKAEYIIMNFWNPVNFSDTSLTHNDKFLEQNFVNFVTIMPYAEVSSQKKAVFKLLNATKVDKETYDKVMDVAEIYLYDPESPMVNETSYIPFMEYIMESKDATPAEKEVAADVITNINKNRPGTVATDFEFTDTNGTQTSLHTVYPDRDSILIFFDPDCNNCKTVINDMLEDSRLSQDINEGKLGVIAIYTGPNKSAWLRSISSLPKEWTVGYEPGLIEEKELYDMRSMPTLYSLTPDKTVIKKDFQYKSTSKKGDKE